MERLIVVFVLFTSLIAFGENTRTKKTEIVPCYDGDRQFLNCTLGTASSNRRALAHATSAAVIIEATREISCGDGSDGCFQTDHNAVEVIQKEVKESKLWDEMSDAEATKADILLKFSMKDRSSISLCAYEADNNELLWCDTRNPIALDNDSSREIAHFLDALKASRKTVQAQ